MKYRNQEETYNIGSVIYCLLSTPTNPNILFPIRAKVLDLQWDAVNPLYKVKIIKFYDSINFIEENFFNLKFRYEFESTKIKAPKISSKRYKNMDELVSIINLDTNNVFVVDSLMCVESKEDLDDLFESVQFYLITNAMKTIKMQCTRLSLTGPFNMSKNEFDKMFTEWFKEKFSEYRINIAKYLKSM